MMKLAPLIAPCFFDFVRILLGIIVQYSFGKFECEGSERRWAAAGKYSKLAITKLKSRENREVLLAFAEASQNGIGCKVAN